MKKITFFTIAQLLSFFTYSQASWHTITSPVNENLVSVCFSDAQHGWILSEDGTILTTSDEGVTWVTSSPGSGGSFTSIHFTDQDHGCVVGYQDSSFILTTDNGGTSWVNRDHPKARHLNDVFFIDENTGWTVGIVDNLNYNLYTSDGGQNWIPQMDIFVVNGELLSVSFRDINSGVTCGVDGIFLKTNSGGTNGWALDVSIPQLGVDLNSVFNWGSLTGCAVGENGTALYTTDKWAQYIETNTNTNLNLNAVSGDVSNNKIWAVGEEGLIIYSPSYLLGWTTQTSGVTENLNDIHMIDEENGWAVGENGTILHYTASSSIYDNIKVEYSVYPNPTEGLVYIENLQDDKEKQVLILDITGKVIFRQVVAKDEIKTIIDISSNVPGIYFMMIKTHDGVYTGKINLY